MLPFNTTTSPGQVFPLTKSRPVAELKTTTMNQTKKKKEAKKGHPPTPAHYLCLRCDWKWVPRKKNGKPARCPSCFSTVWDTPRQPEQQYHCLRCNYGSVPGEWVSRKKNGKPAACPRCQSRDWNERSSRTTTKPIEIE